VKDLRTLFDEGGVAFGCFSLLVEPVFVEILGGAGFDFVILDGEEAGGDSYGGHLDELVRAAEVAGMVPTTRVVENTAGAINRGLNAGNRVIFVPHVRSAVAAASAALAFRYPPAGRRGAAPVVRAARYGLEDWDTYRARADRDNLLIVMIEDQESVANIDEIVATPGVDGVLVGTWDLAVEMGCAGYGPPTPAVMRHVERVIEATRSAGLVMCAHGWSADAAAKYVDLGCQMLIVSLDSTLLLNSLRGVRETVSALVEEFSS
jgi:2-keto-3-deoxy-L-rhamnonate aldolase RhmA